MSGENENGSTLGRKETKFGLVLGGEAVRGEGGRAQTGFSPHRMGGREGEREKERNKGSGVREGVCNCDIEE